MRSRRLLFLFAALLAAAGACKKRSDPDEKQPVAAEDAGSAEIRRKVKRDLYGDPLPSGAVARLGSLRFLDRELRHMEFTPKGDRIISNSAQGYVVWDAKSAQRLFSLDSDDAYWPIAVSPDGRTMATGLLGGKIQLWDLKERTATATLEGHRREANALCFLGGELLASGSDDGTVILWDLNKGKAKETLEGEWAEVNALACSRDGRLLVWGGQDGGIFWLDREAEHWKRSLGHSEEAIKAVAISPDGAYVAAGGADQKIRVWKRHGAKAGDPVVIEAHDHTVLSLAFAPDSKRLFSSGGDVWFREWNPDTGSLVKDITGVESLEAQYMALSPDGTRIASWSEYKTARGTEADRWWLWNAKNGKRLAEPDRHDKDVTAVAFSPDGDKIATASLDTTVRLWNREGKQLAVQTSHQGRVRAVSFSADGKTVWSMGEDAKLHIWDPESGKVRRPLAPVGGEVTSFDLSPNGKTVATGDLTGHVWLFDLDSGKKLVSIDQDVFSSISDVAFNHSGSRLVVTGSERTILVADPKTGDQMALLQPDVVSNFAVAFSPDGELMASAGDDKRVRLWQTDPWKEIGVLKGHDGTVRCVAFSADGKLLASGANDETAMLWDVNKRKRLRVFEGHDGAVTGVAFSPDGELLATSSGDHTALLWTLSR